MSESFQIVGLHHVSLVVSNTARSLDFYQQFLGFAWLPDRPDLGYPGAWLQIGSQQIHLLELPNPDPTEQRPPHVGRDRHMAFSVQGFDELCKKIEAAGIFFTRSRSGRQAIFLRDPDGNGIEFIGC